LEEARSYAPFFVMTGLCLEEFKELLASRSIRIEVGAGNEESLEMARPTKLGLMFEGAEADEFLQNENGTVFTPEQLAFFQESEENLQG